MFIPLHINHIDVAFRCPKFGGIRTDQISSEVELSSDFNEFLIDIFNIFPCFFNLDLTLISNGFDLIFKHLHIDLGKEIFFI